MGIETQIQLFDNAKIKNPLSKKEMKRLQIVTS